MIPLPQCAGKTIGVFGLGKAGAGAIQALTQSGAEVFAWDDNEPPRTSLLNQKLASLSMVPPEEWPWQQMMALVLSPGIPLTRPKPHPVVELAQKAHCPIICDIELLWQARWMSRFIGITGTNGKSTTTALTGHIFKELGKPVAVGGNIGVSALTLEALAKGGTYVLEVSSYQCDLLDQARFNIGVLLNVTPDHLDRHGNMEGYIEAKLRLFRNQQTDDAAVMGVDEPNTQSIYRKLKAEGKRQVVAISQNTPCEGVYFEGEILHNKLSGKRHQFQSLERLPGLHNKQNIAAAFACAFLAGLPEEQIIQAVQSFEGLPHRIQFVAERQGVRFINDSKATNAEATEKALVCFDPIYWILGGVPKESGIVPLEPYFSRIAHAFLIGQAAKEFARTLEGKVAYTHSGTLEKAVTESYIMAKQSQEKRPVVLLSPACASFDQFKNFEERGDQFIALAEGLT